jgi:hypothetical protein
VVRAEGATELLTSYEPGEGNPWPFYQRLGFQPTGEIEDGEMVLRLPLSARSYAGSSSRTTDRDRGAPIRTPRPSRLATADVGDERTPTAAEP